MSPCLDFDALASSQNNANELLQLESVQEALVSHRNEKWVYEISEASLTMVDLCGATKEVLLLIKSHLQILRTKNRRQCLREPWKHKTAQHSFTKLKKEICKCLKSLRSMKNKPVAADIPAVCKDSMVEVVDMLRDVRMACILVLEWTLSAVSDSGTSTRRSIRSMLMCGQSKIISEEVAVEDGERRVEELEGASEELECSFRRLIQTRVSLLNILTSN
ncbi:unnamed protein product [Rhodiola kirilowii]